MKLSWFANVVIAAWTVGAAAPTRAETPSWGREVIHFKVKGGKEEKTGSTESISDPARNMLTQITRNANGVEISRREFVMDTKGRIRNGAIWDGQHRLLARTLYGFDEYDRINEERTFHPNGRVLRRLLFKYDATGRRLPNKFYTWNPQDPYGPLVESQPGNDNATPLLPIQRTDKELPGLGLPQFRGIEAGGKPAAPPAAPPKKEKSGIFQRLFGHDKK
jgi:hypothetical protein